MSDPVDIFRNKFITHKIAVLIPTFNNAVTLQKVITGVLKYTNQVIVVNDGSTDSTSQVLDSFPQLQVVSYPSNRGKGFALRTGFRTAVELGYEYVISIDSDGQHFPDDLPAFIEQLEKDGPALIIGARNMNQSSVPGKSSFGHKFSNFWFLVETGINAPDTQSGYRLYPVGLMKSMRFYTRKFEFEIEVLVRSAWKGISISSVPVSVYYAPAGERVTHFRPFKDFTRISILNTILVIITFLYINPGNFLRALFNKENYRKLRHEIFHRETTPSLAAISVAFGVFMGIIPVWGFQMLIAITIAVALNLNKALVILSANISLPPLIPFIIYLSYQMGGFWMGENSVSLTLGEISFETMHVNFMQYLYGSITLAVVAAIIFGFTAFLLTAFFKRRKISLSS